MLLISITVWSTTALFQQDKPNDDLKGAVTHYGNSDDLFKNLPRNFK